MNKLVKDALVLTLITLIAGVALGLVYEVTKAPIEAANLAAVQSAYRGLFEEAKDFDDDTAFDKKKATDIANKALTEFGANKFAEGDLDIDARVIAIDKNGEKIGEIITVTSHKGYGGNITIAVGIGKDGKLRGYKITDISETPGLGMKATEERFSSQFKEKPNNILTVVKGAGGSDAIEAISGATISSRAVTNAVNAAISYFNSNNDTSLDQTPEDTESDDTGDVPAEEVPAEDAPAQEAPAEDVPAEDVPAEEAPVGTEVENE